MFINLLGSIATKWIFSMLPQVLMILTPLLILKHIFHRRERNKERKEKKRKIRSMDVFSRISEATRKCSKRRNYHEWKSKLIRKGCCWYIPPVWYQRVGLPKKENDFHDSVGVSLLHEPSITSPLLGSSRSFKDWRTYTNFGVTSKPIVKCNHSKCNGLNLFRFEMKWSSKYSPAVYQDTKGIFFSFFFVKFFISLSIKNNYN